MKKFEEFQHDGLFQIGQVASCCGIDRQTILFYEKKGLLCPSAQNQFSGYRYYSAQDVTQLISILQLKDAGLSLREIKDYLHNGAPAAQRVIASMEEKLAALLAGLEQLRALSCKKGDYTVSHCTLPKMRCYIREFYCHGIDEAIENIYAAFQEVLAKGFFVRKSYGIYAEYSDATAEAVDFSAFSMRVYIPVGEKIEDAACADFPALQGISVCHRGDYAQIGEAYAALWAYASARGLEPAGAVRECYLDSRTDFKNNAERYVTRLVLPVMDSAVR